MQAMSVTIQLHKMLEVPLNCGPSTHDDMISVLNAVKLPAAAWSFCSTVDEL